MGFDENLTPDMLPYLYRENNRTGINYVVMALLSGIPGVSGTAALYVFGLLGIAVIFAGIFFLTLELFSSHRVALLAVLLSLILCGYGARLHGNSFTSVEILADAHYASVLSLGISLFLVRLNLRYLKDGSLKSYLLQVFLAFLAFNIHMLTGMEYFLILVILVVVYALREKRLTSRHLQLLSLIPAALALAALWPLYHWWSIFGKNPIEFSGNASLHASTNEFIQRTLLFLIGLPFLISLKKERLFLLVWTVVFALVCLSFHTPFRVAYYWRFAYVMRIPLLIGVALGLGKDIWALKRWKLVAIPVIIAVISTFLGVSIWRTSLRYQDAMQQDSYGKVAEFPPNSEKGTNLIAHPTPGYNLMGISDYNVVSVITGHAPGEITESRNDILRDIYAVPTLEDWRELLEQFDARQVLVPRLSRFSDLQLLLNGVRLASNPYFELFETGPDQLDEVVYTSTPDPDLMEYSERNGFIAYAKWIDVQLYQWADVAVEAAISPDNPGDSYLRAQCDDPEARLLFLNRGYIELDPTLLSRMEVALKTENLNSELYMVVFQYSRPEADALIVKTTSRMWVDSEGWQTFSKILSPEPGEYVGFVLDPATRYVKIGLLLFKDSTGAVAVDSIELLPD